MTQQVPIEAIPNQAFSITLDGLFYEITIKEAAGIMTATIVRDGVTILSNTRATAFEPLIPYRYLEQGNFMFTSTDDQLIYWPLFNDTQFLVFATADELTDIRA